MARKQKVTLSIFIIIIVLLLIVVGGYLFLTSRYPLKYEELILKYAKQYDLDPYFVCAVIWTESKFDPDAESSKGAIGLMQILPDTGEWIAGKIKMEGFSAEKLTDPETNIRLGCWYLSYLEDKFDGDITNIAAGYNAGPAKVEQWLKDEKYSSDGKRLENIPYEETENYVKRERQSYEIYKFFYRFD